MGGRVRHVLGSTGVCLRIISVYLSKAGQSCADNPKIVSNFSWDKYKFLATDTPFKVCFD